MRWVDALPNRESHRGESVPKRELEKRTSILAAILFRTLQNHFTYDQESGLHNMARKPLRSGRRFQNPSHRFARRWSERGKINECCSRSLDVRKVGLCGMRHDESDFILSYPKLPCVWMFCSFLVRYRGRQPVLRYLVLTFFLCLVLLFCSLLSCFL